MIQRSRERFGLYPARLAADSGYGSAEMLGWLVYEQGIEPHISVFDKSERTDSTFSRADFSYDQPGDVYRCPAGKVLTTTDTLVNDGATLLYRASKVDCAPCPLKERCCPNEPVRKVPRSIYEGARDMAHDITQSEEGRTSRRQHKKVEMLFAHLKRILKLDRLRLREPHGARDEFHLAAAAQNLRKLTNNHPGPAAEPGLIGRRPPTRGQGLTPRRRSRPLSSFSTKSTPLSYSPSIRRAVLKRTFARSETGRHRTGRPAR